MADNVRPTNNARQADCAPPAKDKVFSPAHTLCMARTPKMGPKRTFIREWRQYRQLTLQRLADRVGMTHGNLSKIERGILPYNQALLEALAVALQTDPASLLMRNPADPEGIWSIWDKVPAHDRPRVIEVIKAMTGYKDANNPGGFGSDGALISRGGTEIARAAARRVAKR